MHILPEDIHKLYGPTPKEKFTLHILTVDVDRERERARGGGEGGREGEEGREGEKERIKL